MTSPCPSTSPLRRPGLSSMHPEEKCQSQEAKEAGHPPRSTATKSNRFRFKSKRSSSSRRRSPHSNRDGHGHETRHHRKRRRRSATPPDPSEQPTLDPETAFREALFDAMADDEGAEYWERVYGQPMHVYSNECVGPQGELERMTDEEYASHVRQKMWEKTHRGLLEERARRQAEREMREEEKRRLDREERRDRRLREEMARAFQRGEDRRRQKMWARRWREYTEAWTAWDGSADTIPWPTESGHRRDVSEDAIRVFLAGSYDAANGGGGGGGGGGGSENSFVTRLKEERVRWHPDKIQQRLGGEVDDSIMRDVTAIFQVVDKLWGDTRPKA